MAPSGLFENDFRIFGNAGSPIETVTAVVKSLKVVKSKVENQRSLKIKEV
jgi:hypothetical protein